MMTIQEKLEVRNDDEKVIEIIEDEKENPCMSLFIHCKDHTAIPTLYVLKKCMAKGRSCVSGFRKQT